MGEVLQREITRHSINGAPYELDENFADVCLSRRFFVYLDPFDDELFIIQDTRWDVTGGYHFYD